MLCSLYNSICLILRVSVAFLFCANIFCMLNHAFMHYPWSISIWVYVCMCAYLYLCAHVCRHVIRHATQERFSTSSTLRDFNQRQPNNYTYTPTKNESVLTGLDPYK